jgi:hypothetical protein
MPISITNTWSVDNVEYFPEKEGKTNVVAVVHWRCSSSDDTHTVNATGTVYISFIPESDFTPYEELKQSQVIEWVKNAMGEDEFVQIEYDNSFSIANMYTPQLVTPEQLPWSSDQTG